MEDKVPNQYYCTKKEICQFKNHWLSHRCMAEWTIRKTCRYWLNNAKKREEQYGNTVAGNITTEA